MPVRIYKPTSAGRRNSSVNDYAELTKDKPAWTHKDQERLRELVALLDPVSEKREALAKAISLAQEAGYDSLVCECRIYDLSMEVMARVVRLSGLRLAERTATDAEVVKTMEGLKSALRGLRANYECLRLHRPAPPNDGRRGFLGGVGFLELERHLSEAQE